MRPHKKAPHNTPFQPVLSRLRKILHTDRIHHFFSALAQSEKPRELQKEIDLSQLLGRTRDYCQIVLVEPAPGSAVVREIGRLRELTFRKVGEGTGKRRDLDSHDSYYQHLVVWDRKNRIIAGAYRLGEGRRILERHGQEGFYTHSLYHYNTNLLPYLEQGMELGRSFVNPLYWGKASLDYLWQGIGAYLAHHPHIQYLFGPVSMSARYPSELIAELVYYFLQYYPSRENLVRARIPYCMDTVLENRFSQKYRGLDYQTGLDLLQDSFAAYALKMPVLFKQYAGLFDTGGFQTLEFSVDPAFSDCVDGLCMADLSRLKAKKRKRYIPSLLAISENLERNHASGPKMSTLSPIIGTGEATQLPVNLV